MNNPLVRSPCQFQAQMNTINMFNIAVVMPVQAELFAEDRPVLTLHVTDENDGIRAILQ